MTNASGRPHEVGLYASNQRLTGLGGREGGRETGTLGRGGVIGNVSAEQEGGTPPEGGSYTSWTFCGGWELCNLLRICDMGASPQARTEA